MQGEEAAGNFLWNSEVAGADVFDLLGILNWRRDIFPLKP